MCGIAGHIQFSQQAASVSTVEKILDCLSPRGPDGGGIFQQNSICLGHRRLKVIDLSEHSQQPMVDNDLGLVLTFNGCIYNYKELRKELESKGYRFFSTGDSEVILKAYKEWGEKCVDHFNGMFAFAILERDTQNVFIARDRLGIKPLYYCEKDNGIYFSSSLPSLLEIPNISKEIDRDALHFYLSLHSVVPAPMTILQSVRKLPQGCSMMIKKNSSIRIDNYWKGPTEGTSEDESRSFEDWKSLIREKLTNAVRRRLVADVPVGVLLSGGLDSSLLVGLMRELGHTDLETFSIGFQSTAELEGNEFKYSDIIAKKFQTKHHQLQIDSSMLLSQMQDCVASMSEPMVSHDNIGFYLLSKEVSKHLKVVQSGQGADEVFGGYHWYPPMIESNNPVETYQKHFFDRSHQNIQEMLQSDFCSPENISQKFIEGHFMLPGAKLAIDKALRVDTTIMLVDDPVKRVDNMTMRWGLEARVPFIDHELVELAAKMPARHKIKGQGKYILKEIAREIIPAEVIDRPKGYFPVPQLKHIQGESLEFMREILLSSQSEKRGVFKKPYLEKMLSKPEEHITPLGGSSLWQACLLEYWLQTQNI